MKRVACVIVLLMGCNEAEEPDTKAEGRMIASFDPAEFELLTPEDLEASPLFVQKDGERVELQSIAEADLIVRQRDRATLGEATPVTPLVANATTGSAPQLNALNCSRHTEYEVPFEETVHFCTWTRAGWLCSSHQVVVYHDIGCIQSCSHPTEESCYDFDAGASTSTPSSEYAVDQFYVPCSPGGSCGS